MMHSALGLPQDRSGVYGEVQRHLAGRGLGVYLPQLLTGESANIGLEYDPVTGGLVWKPATLVMMRNVQAPMVFAYGAYWYSSSPRVLRWQDKAGGYRSQDELMTAEISGYLRNTNNWLVSQGIRNAWVLVDEPPHLARYGLTPELEARVVKFCNAVKQSGMGVAIATPNPTHLDFWRQRVNPSWWIVQDGGTFGRMPGCWLYNARTFVGLAERMRTLGAVGYLQWSAVQTTKTNPLPVCVQVDGDAWTATEHLDRLAAELAQGPLTLDERVTALEKRVSDLEKR